MKNLLAMFVMVGFSLTAQAQNAGMWGGGIGFNPYGMSGWMCVYKGCKIFSGGGMGMNSCSSQMGGFGCVGPFDYAKVESQESALKVCREKLEAKQKGAQEYQARSLSKTERKENKQADKLATLSLQVMTKQMYAGCTVDSVQKFTPMVYGSGGMGKLGVGDESIDVDSDQKDQENQYKKMNKKK